MFAWWLDTIKHVWWTNILSFGHLVRCCLMAFSAVWSSFEHSYCSRVWCAVLSSFGRLHQTCLAHACVPLTMHPTWLLGACLMASLIYFWPRHQTRGKFYVIFQKRVRVFHRGFQTRENWWKHEAVGRVLLLPFSKTSWGVGRVSPREGFWDRY